VQRRATAFRAGASPLLAAPLLPRAGRGAALTIALLFTGGASAADRAFEPSQAPPELRPPLERAAAAIRGAACEVERRFGEGDPDANAGACESVEPVPDAKVGRTSARLRNPANAPPGWARGYVAQTGGKKASQVAAAAFDLGDRVGLLRPIEIRRRCLQCHAPREALAEGTRAWLSRSYPQDQAVGYALGDLRGFWWAEVPKSGP